MRFEINQKVKCINNQCLQGNDYAPTLKVDQEYEIKEIILDKAGNQHLNVGLSSNLSYIRSWDTKEELPRGQEIHWCHPSRFELV